MRLDFTVDETIRLSFIPFSFFLLEDLFKDFKIKSLSRVAFGVFEEGSEDLYIDLTNYKDFIGEITSIKNLLLFFSKYDEECYSIYKLGVEFEDFEILYDDDSLIIIKSDDVSKYDVFHSFYLKLFDLYKQENYKLDV